MTSDQNQDTVYLQLEFPIHTITVEPFERYSPNLADYNGFRYVSEVEQSNETTVEIMCD